MSNTTKLRNLDKNKPARKVTCGNCGEGVVHIQSVPISPTCTQRVCDTCAPVVRYTAPEPILAPSPSIPAQLAERERISAELGATYFQLQRPALPAGDAIAMPIPEEQPIAIPLATIVLDTRMHQHAALEFEHAYAVRLAVVKRGIVLSKPAPNVIDITPRLKSSAAWSDEATKQAHSMAGQLVALYRNEYDWRTGIITRKERKHEQHMEIAKAA